MNRIELGDCLEVMRTLPANSVDAVVTDPPYGLTQSKKGGSGAASVNLDNPYGRARIGAGNGAGGFMGLGWDSEVPSTEIWAECLRVLKPGGYLLAFAGTRTQHRIAARIEDAGFEIRDMLAWVYGSGFPKSHNGEWGGTALKPALEPITMARKPLGGTVEQNWREYGTGALNIDACRVLGEKMPPNTGAGGLPRRHTDEQRGPGVVAQPHDLGRWPANLIHDGSEDVLGAFPDSAGSGASRMLNRGIREGDGWGMNATASDVAKLRDAGAGSAARFFYCAKASNADRDEGMDGFEKRSGGMVSNTGGQHITRRDEGYQVAPRANNHPTVKPTDLMRYLCRLVTPAGGVVLDPFMGSGSTGKAAALEGFGFIGIEREAEYLEIARARIEHARLQWCQQSLPLEVA